MAGGGVNRVADVDWRSGSMADCGEGEGDRWSGGGSEGGGRRRYGCGLCTDCGVASIKENMSVHFRRDL